MSSTNPLIPSTADIEDVDSGSSMLEPAIFKLMTDTAPIIILMLDTRGAIQYVNPYFERLSGYTLDEIKDRDWFSTFLPRRDQDYIRSVFQSVAAQDAPLLGNINPIITRSGEERHIEWNGQAMRNAQGDITAVISIGQDISDRVRAEKERMLSEQRLQLAVHSGRVGIYDHDHLTGAIYCSPELRDIFGFTSEDAVDLTHITQCVHKEDRDRFTTAVAQASDPSGNGSFDMGCRIKRRNGEQRWLEISSQTLFGEINGCQRKLRTMGIVRDITQHKRDQRMLQMMKFSIDHMNDKVTWIDSEAKIVYANIAACRSLGYSSEEMHRLSVPDFDPDFPKDCWPEHWEAIKKNGSFTFETRHRTKSGEIYPVEVCVNYMRFEDVEYNCGYARDITKRKQIEEELRIAATTFDSQDAVLITDQHANILRVNQAFQDMTGYRDDELIGKNLRILKSGHHDAEFFSAMWAELLDAGKWSGEMWCRRSNDEVFPTAVTITAVYDDNRQITNYVSVTRDISHIKQTEREIHQLAFYDHLTQLPNRRLLQDRLQHTIAGSVRHGWYAALIFLDLDHFKTINDTQGHIVGDHLLIEVAKRLRSCVREIDSVARLGGDEFVVIIEELSSETGEAVAQIETIVEKIRNELNKPYKLNNYTYLSTASIGINLFHGHQNSVEELFKHADIAMYQAKIAGRNATRFYDPSMQAAIEARADLEDELRQALAMQQFQLHYQIQMDKQRRPLGAEALLRWKHPTRGMVSPATFIATTEDTGLIVPIGLWVLQTACAQLKAWQHNDLTRDLTLAVNVSARQFRQPDFVSQIKWTLLQSGARPSQLKLELTESTVLEDVEDAIIKMRELKSLGVSFSMDDFGTGYSSLQYLKRLPLDQIKIDQSFVRDITVDPNDDAIVQTIIAMSKALGLSVIAEGVESEIQREFLDRHDCDAFQGYLFGKPLPPAEFESLLRMRF
jgi:diguanylate cyclase (GGDEF)-like protein/PAS domain S-box-containing protein